MSNPIAVLALAHLTETLKLFNFGLHLLTSKPSFFFQWTVNQGLFFPSLLDCISGVSPCFKLTPVLVCLGCYNEIAVDGVAYTTEITISFPLLIKPLIPSLEPYTYDLI